MAFAVAAGRDCRSVEAADGGEIVLSRWLLSSVAVASMAFTGLAGCMDVGSFDDGSLLAAVTCPTNVPRWAEGVSYKTGDLVSFVEPADPKQLVRFFKVLQPHTSLSTWTPTAAVSLFEEVTCSGVKPPPATPTTPTTPAPPAPAPTPANGALAATYAPYFFAFGWNNPAFPFRGLADMKAKTGLSGATLAFVLAKTPFTCAATTDVFDNQADVNKFVAGGGLVKGVDSVRAFSMLGVTPMIGVNDTPSEVFTIADVATVTSFVKLNHVGLVSFWGINRDQPGADIAISTGSNAKVAGVATFAFTTAFTKGLGK